MKGPGFARARRFASQLVAVMALAAAVPAALAAPALADATPKVDVLFEVDTTGSMGDAMGEVKSEIGDTMQKIEAGGVADVEFGLAEVKDYPPDGLGDGWYGSPTDNPPDVPWTLRAPIGPASAVATAAQAFTAEGGGDAPEAYGRALYEADTNPNIGWRSGARRFIVLIADNVPHDTNLNAGVPAEYQTQPSPFDTHPDPGPDGIPFTADDISWQTELHNLSADGIPLLFVYYHGTPAYLPYWSWWAGETGGADVNDTGSGQLEDDIVNLVTDGEATPLPPCPSGETRNTDNVCSTPSQSTTTTPVAPSAPYGCSPLPGGGYLCSPPVCGSAAASPGTGSPAPSAGSDSSAPAADSGSSAPAADPLAIRAHAEAAGIAPSWITDPLGDWSAPPTTGFGQPSGTPLTDITQVKGTCPVILAEGDSVTSGHNIDHYRGQNGRLMCEDLTYSYPYFVWLQARKDDRWKQSPYVNAAYSGFGTAQVLDGGKDACGQSSAGKPIDTVVGLLGSHKQPATTKIGSGNLVLQSVGINDAPWTQKLMEIIADQKKSATLKWPNITFAGMSEARCQALLKEKWDPVVGKELPQIRTRAGQITKALIAADPTVKIFWLDYYNFAGTGYLSATVKLPWGRMRQTITAGPLLPTGCTKPFAERRDEIDKALHEGVDDGGGDNNVQFVNTGLDRQAGLLQPVVGVDGLREALEKAAVTALDKVQKALETGALKTEIGAVDVARRLVETAEQAVDKAPLTPPKLKQAAEAELDKARQALMGKEDALQQALDGRVNAQLDFESWGLKNYFELGWPHPNGKGHAAIAAVILKALGL